MRVSTMNKNKDIGDKMMGDDKGHYNYYKKWEIEKIKKRNTFWNKSKKKFQQNCPIFVLARLV